MQNFETIIDQPQNTAKRQRALRVEWRWCEVDGYQKLVFIQMRVVFQITNVRRVIAQCIQAIAYQEKEQILGVNQIVCRFVDRTIQFRGFCGCFVELVRFLVNWKKICETKNNLFFFSSKQFRCFVHLKKDFSLFQIFSLLKVLYIGSRSYILLDNSQFSFFLTISCLFILEVTDKQ